MNAIGTTQLSRRTLLKGLGAAGAGLALASCGGGGGDSGGGGGDKTLRFQSFQGADIVKVWDTQFADFKKQNGVTVTHEYVDSSKQSERLLTLAATNQLPDVAMVSAQWYRALASRGILEEMTSDKLSGLDLDGFWKPLKECYVYNDKLYGLPTDLDMDVLFYNKDLFDEAKVAYPTTDWTWDDYHDAAQALTKGSGGGKQYGADNSLNRSPQLNIVAWSYDGYLIDPKTYKSGLESGGGLKALELYETFVRKDQIIPPPSSDVDITTGKVAMELSGPYEAYYSLSNAKFKWDVTTVPRGDKQATDAWGSCLVVFKTSKLKDEAFKFVSFFESDDLQFQRAKDWAWYPPSKGATEMAEFTNNNTMALTSTQKEIVKSSIDFAQPPVVVREYQQVSTLLKQGTASIANGQATAAQAAAQITKAWEPLLAEDRQS
jgi:multiple sugar transport system substrate-binding protein